MGPKAACTVPHDGPGFAHEMIDSHCGLTEQYVFPLIERLRPEIVNAGEDRCYNHGMMVSPERFEEFCGPFYRKVGRLAVASGADMVAIDTDGNATEFAPLVESCGVNAVFAFEAKAGNHLSALRGRQPEFMVMGWLKKESVSEGNEAMIEREMMSRMPRLLERGRYFPNGDHGLQPLIRFDSMCRFMTLLHDVTGNPEGEFPRV